MSSFVDWLAAIRPQNTNRFALIANTILFLLPIMLLAWLFAMHMNHMRMKVDQELAGLRVVRPVVTALAQLTSRDEKKWPGADAISKAMKRDRANLKPSEDFKLLVPAIEGSDRDRSLAIEAATSLVSLIGDHSNLHYDSKKETYYLMDMLLHQLPTLLVESNEVIDRLVLEASTSTVDSLQRSHTLSRIGTLATARSKLLRAYRSAVDGNDGKMLREQLVHPSVVLAGTVNLFISNVQLMMTSYSGRPIDTADVRGVETQFAQLHMEAVTLSKIVDKNLERLLKARHDKMAASRNTIFFVTVLTTLLGLGLTILIFRRMIFRHDDEIVFLAHHDELTGLANRKQFSEELEQRLEHVRRGSKLAVHCIDLDMFKQINDTLGHPVGDRVLKAVGERLQENVRATDTIARLGGDEFAIIQADTDRPEDASDLADRLVTALSEPFEIYEHHIEIGISIGIALAPGDGLDTAALMRQADLALYRSKAEGRGTFRFFEQHMDDKMQARRASEIELKNAIKNDEFEVHYQPLINLASDEVACFEALVRWQHPIKGRIAPDQFIPLAEETGLIVPIGAWVLHQACSEATNWPSHIRLAVNLSPGQLSHPSLIPTVTAALRDTGLDAHRLELEITETMALSNADEILRILNELHAIGVRISMDDFGTGYTSLGILRTMPFDHLKIDRSFITELDKNHECAAIVGAVSKMAYALGMKTTAEGIETIEELDAVRANGCSEAQGYWFSKPCPSHEIPELLKRLGKSVAA